MVDRNILTAGTFVLVMTSIASGGLPVTTPGYKFLYGAKYYGPLAEEGDAWFELLDTGDGWELKSVELVLTPSYYDTTWWDWEREANGTDVSIAGSDHLPRFLFSSAGSAFSEGPVAVAMVCENFESDALPPDTSCIFSAAGVSELELYTTEEGLFLREGNVTQHVTDTYPGEPGVHSPNYIALVLVGDLDRDGSFDLIVNDVSDSYNYFYNRLFLSSEAGPDSLLREVAAFYDVYY